MPLSAYIIFGTIGVLGIVLSIMKIQFDKHPEWFPNDKNHPGQPPKDKEK